MHMSGVYDGQFTVRRNEGEAVTVNDDYYEEIARKLIARDERRRRVRGWYLPNRRK